MNPTYKWLIVLSACAVFILFLAFWRRRRRKKLCVFPSSQKHPTGFVKYHPRTETKVRQTLGEDDDAKAVAVLRFKGDLQASARFSLSRLIDEVLLNKESFVEVVLKVESPGGSVTDYGHAYAEVRRLADAGMRLTVCVDTVAASGGYLMSLPAHQILAAPFAMVGSIGVVSFVPNLRKLLQKLNIEPRTFTAGDYKRTVTMTDDATPEQVERYREQLQLIHDQFKQALTQHRPNVDVTKVATGEAWLASTSVAKDLKLVDALRVSSDYLLDLNRRHDLVEFSEKRSRVSTLRQILDWLKMGFSLISHLGNADRLYE